MNMLTGGGGGGGGEREREIKETETDRKGETENNFEVNPSYTAQSEGCPYFPTDHS